MRLALACAVAFVAVAIHVASADGTADYELRLPRAAEIALGDTGAVSLTIAPAEGFSISKDAPLVVALRTDPAEGLRLPRTRYTRRHAADARADAPRFDLAVEARSAGDYALKLSIRFWVCQKKTCRPVTESRSVAIRVPAPPPPPADAGPGDAAPTDAVPPTD